MVRVRPVHVLAIADKSHGAKHDFDKVVVEGEFWERGISLLMIVLTEVADLCAGCFGLWLFGEWY